MIGLISGLNFPLYRFCSLFLGLEILMFFRFVEFLEKDLALSLI